jgi:hypothetical protein
MAKKQPENTIIRNLNGGLKRNINNNETFIGRIEAFNDYTWENWSGEDATNDENVPSILAGETVYRERGINNIRFETWTEDESPYSDTEIIKPYTEKQYGFNCPSTDRCKNYAFQINPNMAATPSESGDEDPSSGSEDGNYTPPENGSSTPGSEGEEPSSFQPQEPGNGYGDGTSSPEGTENEDGTSVPQTPPEDIGYDLRMRNYTSSEFAAYCPSEHMEEMDFTRSGDVVGSAIDLVPLANFLSPRDNQIITHQRFEIGSIAEDELRNYITQPSCYYENQNVPEGVAVLGASEIEAQHLPEQMLGETAGDNVDGLIDFFEQAGQGMGEVAGWIDEQTQPIQNVVRRVGEYVDQRTQPAQDFVNNRIVQPAQEGGRTLVRILDERTSPIQEAGNEYIGEPLREFGEEYLSDWNSDSNFNSNNNSDPQGPRGNAL